MNKEGKTEFIDGWLRLIPKHDEYRNEDHSDAGGKGCRQSAKNKVSPDFVIF
jgi:hypothetical protein